MVAGTAGRRNAPNSLPIPHAATKIYSIFTNSCPFTVGVFVADAELLREGYHSEIFSEWPKHRCTESFEVRKVGLEKFRPC